MNDNLIILSKKIEAFNKNYNKYKEIGNINDFELNENICDILSWIEICIKAIKNMELKDRQIISAIKYANNMKKHSIAVFTYNFNTYPLYPSNNLYPSNDLYPSDFGIFWNNLPLDNEKYKSQYSNYNKCLKGKEIRSTINDIFEIIKKNTIEY